MANMFDKAKKDGAVKKDAPAKAKNKPQVDINGLEEFAEIDALMKALKAKRDALEAEVKEQVADHFIEAGLNRKARPENPEAYDGNAEASIQLKKRSSRSVLSEDEQRILDHHKIPTTVIEEQVETFQINPEYAADGDMLAKVSAALEGVVPDDFIQHVPQRAKTVADEKSIDAIFKKKAEVARELLDVVAVIAVRPKLKDSNIGNIAAKVAKMFK